MGSDRARVSFDPSRKWRGLVAQQGRVTVEADWNEAAAIDAERDRLATLDIVGPLGTPDGGYAVTAVAPGTGSPPAASPPSGSPGDLSIGPGTLYLGGERLDLDSAVVLDASDQADWLDASTDQLFVAPVPPPPSPPGSPPSSSNELVYLIAIEQEVSAVEDPELADVALGGPDTMQRLRILQRFVRWTTAAADCGDAWAEVQSAWSGIGLELDPATMQLESSAQLLLSFDPVPPSSGPCEPPATGGYLGPENQLIRVQVSSVDPSSGVPTIAWGFDDATFLYELVSAIPTASGGLQVTLAKSPVDSYHYPVTGQTVELLRDAAAVTMPGALAGSPPSSATTYDYIASASGFATAVTTSYSPTQLTLTVAGQPPGDYLSTSATPQLYLRVWQGSAPAPPGTVVELETAGATTGVQVTLSSAGGFHVGDFWRFALRPSVPQLVYPARIAAAPQAPDGPRVWACPIAFVSWPSEGDPTISSCVPAFDNLVELSGRLGGCCTLDITPADLGGQASLQSLLAPYAGAGPVRVCLSPGTYTLSEPLVLGREFDGITIEGCSPGVVFEAPPQPGQRFVLGLVALAGVRSATIRGITFDLPLVSFAPAPGSFNGVVPRGLSDTNQVLLDEFGRDLEVAIGVSLRTAEDLTLDDCQFVLDTSNAGGGVLAAGIYGSGELAGVVIEDCSFSVVPAPATAPFYDLAAGNKPAPPYQLSFGYLQAPSTLAESDYVAGLLHEATVKDCMFQSVTVPLLAIARLGNVVVESSTVQDCYGGFWLVDLGSSARSFDLLPIGDAAARGELVKLGLTALADGIFVIATAMARVLPAGVALDTFGPRLVEAASEVALAQETADWQRFLVQAASAEPSAGGTDVPPVAGAALPMPSPELLHAYPNLEQIIQAVGTQAPAVPVASDTGTGVMLRLDVHDCQVDAVVADSYSGAALLVADLSAVPGSVLVHDNRLRNRFPEGQTALLAGIGSSSVTGNVVANEIAEASSPSAGGQLAYSLVLREGNTGLTTAPVAVVGNVLIGTAVLPGRPSGLPGWETLNAVLVS